MCCVVRIWPLQWHSSRFLLLNTDEYTFVEEKNERKTMMIRMTTLATTINHRKRTLNFEHRVLSFNPWVICHHLNLFQPLIRCAFVSKWLFELRRVQRRAQTLCWVTRELQMWVIIFLRIFSTVFDSLEWQWKTVGDGTNTFAFRNWNVRTKLHDKWLQTIFTNFHVVYFLFSFEQLLIEGNALHFRNDINS